MPAPITFAPRRGAILICDFGLDPSDLSSTAFRPVGVWPEITKKRRAVVVSPDALNVRHGNGPGLCVVVPISITPQWPAVPSYHIPLSASDYRALTADGWAKCNLPVPVSHDRLTLPQVGGKLIRNEFVSRRDMALIDAALRIAMGL